LSSGSTISRIGVDDEMLNQDSSPKLFVEGLEKQISYLKNKKKFGSEEVLLLHHLQQLVSLIRPDLSEVEATSLRIELQLLGSPDSRQWR
jgi:hypothetical protein